MHSAAVIIPNYNGMKFLKGCLSSLRKQSFTDFETVMVDNGSDDESVRFVQEHFPEVRIVALEENTGFCHAVNLGIQKTDAEYVLLLNNDTVCGRHMVGELVRALEKRPRAFSCAARMISLYDKSKLDDAGDFYCALGWAFARGKGKDARKYLRAQKIFACCAAAAIYRREMLSEVGLFDEAHFAYLEDIDLGYRAQLHGYENWYIPSAVVYHAGSGTSGSTHNAFKVSLSSRNSIYLIKKNMPLWQVILNLPLLTAGILIKGVYFTKKGFGRQFWSGTLKGFCMDAGDSKTAGNMGVFLTIQLQLWVNTFIRVGELT